jgi:hypothetical protein
LLRCLGKVSYGLLRRFTPRNDDFGEIGEVWWDAWVPNSPFEGGEFIVQSPCSAIALGLTGVVERAVTLEHIMFQWTVEMIRGLGVGGRPRDLR